jgi:hypothetical protein
MSELLRELLRIEEQERNGLFKLGWMFKNSLNDFSTSMDRSLRYLDRIVLPIIMGSKNDKSYNPFSEIIEKYVSHILIRKFEKEGYSLLPLGYSADLTLENDHYILNIDIKTANIDNPSDFRETINVGINQLTHVAKLRLAEKFLPSPYFVYPNIPPFYQMQNGSKKLILTYALMFIYPSYRDLVDNIRKEYHLLFDFFNQKLKSALLSILQENFELPEEEAQRIIGSIASESGDSKDKRITESLIRGVFIHRQEYENILRSLKISEEEHKKIIEFMEQVENFTNKLREKDIKPIAIIAISLPNGLLKDKYVDRFVSGKDYARSSRYHYKDGIFEVIKEKTGEEFPRVIFIDLNRNYLDTLKNFFDKIVILDYHLKKL